jgi:hypothetical protein
MPLTNDAIAQKMFEALRDSGAILDKCQELFGKPHMVCLGLSGEDAPPPEECPVFEVIAWNKERGEAPDNWPWAFSINVFLADEQKERDITTTGVKTLINLGPQSLETIMDLAEAAVTAALTNLDFEDLSFIYDPILFFPIFAGVLNLNISFPKLGGGYQPTL